MNKMKWRVLREEEYLAKVEKVITRHEGNVTSVYIDDTGIPTVGPGKALVVNVNKKWVVSQGRSVEGVETLEASIGKKLTLEQMEMLQQAADNLNQYGQSPKAYQENAKIYYENDQIRGSKAWKTPNNSSFGIYLDKDQNEELNNRVMEATEKELDRATGMQGSEAIPPSEERAALTSIFHHKPRAITPEMQEALKNGDRAKVIAEIDKDASKNERFANRRKLEADQFGRPNDPAIIQHENNPQADLENQMRTSPRSPTHQKPGQSLPQHEPKGPSSAPTPTTATRGSGGGAVFVHPYSRRNGEVQSHTRSRPDDRTENNLNTQKK
jgi:GH24 family phage-related lysozyme (muramidase)